MADAKRYEYQGLVTGYARRDRRPDVTMGRLTGVITRPG